MRRIVLASLLLAACNSGDDGPSDDVQDDMADADADATTDVDASSDDTSATCTGALYEECVMNTDCTSGICREYNGLGFSACTTACTPGDDSTCPAHPQGAEVTCNRTQAQCRPSALAACTP